MEAPIERENKGVKLANQKLSKTSFEQRLQLTKSIFQLVGFFRKQAPVSKISFGRPLLSRDCVTGGSEGSADPPDFLKLQYKNAIKSEFSYLRDKFLEDLRSLTPLTFGPRGALGDYG